MTTNARRPDERDESGAQNFIANIIEEDLASGRHSRVVTRFPPEPNGYLHIGHVKSICLNFGLARDFKGVCHLRMDDTNPTTEDVEYVENIQRDVRWLGFDWADKLFYASDYFDRLHGFAVELIKKGKAYVDSLSETEIREYRGTVTEPGRPSPYRDRSVEENLDLFERMRKGEFPEGAHVLRMKGDLASPNMKMRDWPMYRIKRAHHYRTGDKWCIYPLYDFAHSLSDAIEGITHSICTLEFENNRELYDWFVENVDVPARPRQYEFARLNLTYTVMSKRKLLELVKGGSVRGWDDPRMPTIAGMRRRGVTPEALRAFCEEVGVAKANSTVEVEKLEHFIRGDLDRRSPRVMAVLRPLKVVLENYPEDRVEEFDVPYFPDDAARGGARKVPFCREFYIEKDDFALDPPDKWHRLAPGREVRLRNAYIIKCHDVIKHPDTGEVVELRCTYDPASRGEGGAEGGRKVKGTLHWVSVRHALRAEVRLYDRLFRDERPDLVEEGVDWKTGLNPESLAVAEGAALEPSLATAEPGKHFQFERQGFFFVDPVDAKPGAPVFNRTVSLKDSWAKIAEPKAPPKAQERPKAEEKAAKRLTPEERLAGLDPARQAEVQRFEGRGLGREEAIVLAEDPALGRLFEEAAAAHASNLRGVASLVINELPRALKGKSVETLPFGGAAVGELVALIDDRTITPTIAKEVLLAMLEKGGSPRAIVEQKGMRQVSDASAIEPIVDRVIAEHAGEVARYRAGNQKLIGFFVGRVMKLSNGKANAELVNELLTRKLG
ncbi:glutamine--tRNA ligase/YqeY domain fusion protein [Polyangium aurulentum]|uniref:glutamine--tRNA ligase/YqeY domain fusion protein n=1 Tax=Polyangium aurulentum TaxID=2567896 RepID=UPI0010AE3955|nr:glutamine--tRNA ligase/YqeY domain fusion protein [Polyangium aurulentum]UQA56745.1 glutamine--tRNA ligase/YqeY domain fusion protein [Polyangium aurulentum]